MDVFYLWWLLPDSNWGHKALQASALPTELKSHIIIITVNVRVWLLPDNSLRSSPLNHLGKENWFSLSLDSFASPNWGHKALQASALPTELKSRVTIGYNRSVYNSTGIRIIKLRNNAIVPFRKRYSRYCFLVSFSIHASRVKYIILQKSI